jgi:2-amino-4-hydroxy-6-hydroxymethyldihydropteridine diphosphokinase
VTRVRTPVLVAAGSNVEPFEHLPRALDALQARFAPITVSPAYVNAAVGFEGEPFVNLVVAFDTDLEARAVVERLREVEAACGRDRAAPRWGPHTMDLDILLYGDLVCAEPGLNLPRPDLLHRSYVLRPAAEIAPERRHPTAGRTLGELWRELAVRGAHAMRAVELDWPAR